MIPIPSRGRQLAALAAVFAVAGTAYFVFRPNPRPAPAPQPPAALLLVDARPPGLLPGGTPWTPSEIDTYRKTQAALVKSEFVANAALRDGKARALEVVRAQPDALAWLTERVTAEYHDGSSVLRVGVTGVTPHEAAVLANAVAVAYLAEATEAEVRRSRDRLAQLEDACGSLRRTADQRREELRQQAAVAGVPPDRADQRALLAALYQERAGLRVEFARTRAADGGPDAGPTREKVLRDELVALDGRIKACEQADLDAARAEVARLDAAAAALAAEATRLKLDGSAPPRVYLLQPAALPEK